MISQDHLRKAREKKWTISALREALVEFHPKDECLDVCIASQQIAAFLDHLESGAGAAEVTTCSCPEGWPQLKERGFDARAEFIAWLNRIRPPRFTVRAHRYPCLLSDEVVRAPMQRKVVEERPK